MSADKSKQRPFASDRVNPHERNELKFWCQKFDCSDMQLKNAVMAVGTSASAVRDFLKGRKVN
jgi:hypothetical protein